MTQRDHNLQFLSRLGFIRQASRTLVWREVARRQALVILALRWRLNHEQHRFGSN